MSPLVDIHTHLYLPRYAAWLRTRSIAPKIMTLENGEERLLILENEPSGGRPVGPQYWAREDKLKFMDLHGIDVSFVSTANPWLDFLSASEAHELALGLNTDLEEYCSSGPALTSSLQRLYGFGLLPLVPGIEISALIECVEQIASLPHLKGLIMGTRGVGKGLDDPALNPVWEAIAKAGLTVFLHPHYGVDPSAWGEVVDSGHVLPLALGFPFETTTATARLILSGVFDAYPSLKLLLAHSGGALPQLSSRLASCIDHDPLVAARLKHDARFYLGLIYFDAVSYGPEELGFVSEVVDRAQRFESGAEDKLKGKAADRKAGSKRMLFGTDHPFFPPLKGEEVKWKSVVENLEAIESVVGWGSEEKEGVRGGNALALFGLV